MEELLAKADKDSDSTNGGRGNVPTKPNGNWKDPIVPPAAKVIKILQCEFQMAMVLTGTTDIGSIDRSVIW